MPVEEASALLSSLRDDLVSRTETRTAVRVAAAESACLEVQEYLAEELEERLRKHWPRKGRTEVRRCVLPITCIASRRHGGGFQCRWRAEAARRYSLLVKLCSWLGDLTIMIRARLPAMGGESAFRNMGVCTRGRRSRHSERILPTAL